MLNSSGPRLHGPVPTDAGSGHEGLVVEPAELELVPGTQVTGAVADHLLALGAEPALRHQRPVLVVVVPAGQDVVVVREPEVVAVLVEEHAPAAVLRLDRVVGDPDAAGADLVAAVGVARRALAGALEGLPPVRPDGVLALPGVAVGLVAARVHDLEVVDVAVGLVEVAVAVEVVAVPLVEGRQLGVDLGDRPARGQLVGVPLVGGVLNQVPGVAADVAGTREAVGPAVAGLVVLHPHPVGDLAVHAVAAGRLLLVVRLERLDSGAVPEVRLLVVRPVVVRLPDGRVVDGAVRLRDLVDRRAVEPRWARDGGVGVLVRVLRMTGVPELGQDHEDAVGGLASQLDVLTVPTALVAELDDRARTSLHGSRLAVEDGLDGFLPERAPLVLLGIGQLVGGDALFLVGHRLVGHRSCRGVCDRGGLVSCDCRLAHGEAQGGDQAAAKPCD